MGMSWQAGAAAVAAAVHAPGPGPGSSGRRMGKSPSVRFSGYSFGSVGVDGVAYDHDLIIDRGKIRKRKKGPSRQFRGAYGHTPLSVAEDIPWRCRRLVIGTGAAGALPVMNDVRDQARRRGVDLVVLPTAQAITVLAKATKDTNAILHQRHLAPDLLTGPRGTANTAAAAWLPLPPQRRLLAARIRLASHARTPRCGNDRQPR
jgi:hypothetical protein